MTTALLLRLIHIFSDLIWIGSIAAVGLILAAPVAQAKERGQLARRVYLGLAVPAFVAAFIAGVLRLIQDYEYFFIETKFMHAKLLFALAVIGLHHVLGARAKRMAEGKTESAGSAERLSGLLVIAAALTAFFAVYRPF